MCKVAIIAIKLRAQNGTVDVLEWFTYLTTDIISQLGFGESFGMLKLGRVSKSNFQSARLNC